MLRLLVIVLAALLAAAAAPEAALIDSLSSGEPSARRAAAWLGRVESARGLAAILERGDESLLRAYVEAFPEDYGYAPDHYPFVAAQLPAAVEAQLSRHLGDAQRGPLLLNLLRKRQYRGRALFATLLQQSQRDPGDWGPLSVITHTDLPDIETPLLARLPQLGAGPQRVLIRNWRERRWPPSALPLLRQLAMRGEPCYEAIAAIGTPPAVDFLVQELERPASTPATAAALLRALARLPADQALPMARIVAALPRPITEVVAWQYLALLERRRSGAGLDDLLGLATDPQVGYRAVFVMRQLEAPAWPRIREGLAALREQGPLPYHAGWLLADLADPQRYAQKQSRLFRDLERERRQRALEQQYEPWLELLETRDAARHAQVQARYDEARRSIDRGDDAVMIQMPVAPP